MMSIAKELTAPKVKKPAQIDQNETDLLTLAVWKKQVANYVEKLEQVEQNTKALFAIIWGQCSESMKAKLKSLPGYSDMNDDSNCVELLKAIRGVMLRFEGQRKIFLSLDDAEYNLTTFKQLPEMSLANYKAEYENLVEVYEHYGGAIGLSPGCIQAVAAEVGNEKLTDAEKAKIARNKTIAMAFLKRADRRRFGTLWTDLENNFSRGLDQYPADLTEAYGLLVSFRPTYSSRVQTPPAARATTDAARHPFPNLLARR